MAKAIPHFENEAVAVEIEQSDDFVAAMLILKALSPFYWRYVVKHLIIWTYKIPTAATDGIYLYMNPNFFLSLPNDNQRATLFAHEVVHIVLKHGLRGKAYRLLGYFRIVAGTKIPFIHKLWNWICDAIINDDLIALGFEPIDTMILDERYGRDWQADDAYADKYAEWEQEQEEEEAGEQEGEQEGEGDESGDESGEGGEGQGGEGDPTADESGASDGSSGSPGDEQGEDSGEGDEQEPVGSEHDGHDIHGLEPKYEGTPEEIAEAKGEDEAEADHTLREALKDRQDAIDQGRHKDIGLGAGIGEAVKAGDHRHTGHVSWTEEFADLFNMAGTGGDVTFTKMHRRRYSVMGVVTPATVGRLRHITFIGDISSSVDRTVFKSTMNEMAVVIDELEPTDGVAVLFTNTDVTQHHDVVSGGELLDLEIPCGGGTYLTSALDYMEEQGIDSDVTVAFTDGYIGNDDLIQLVENDVVIVLDHILSRYEREELEEVGARYIVAVDEVKAA
jgi:predicted metal-dependent peptidase